MSRPSFSTAHIEYLEKRFLDQLDGKIDLSHLKTLGLGASSLLKIKGMSNFWELREEKIVSLRLFMEDIISGLHEAGIPLIFAIFGGLEKVEIVMGTATQAAQEAENGLKIIKTSLQSSFQGIELEEQPPNYLKSLLENFEFSGLVTGISTEKAGTERMGAEQIERLLRGLYGKDYGYLVLATPAKKAEINNSYNSVLNELRIIIEEQARSEKGAGLEVPIAKRYKELLEVYLNKLQSAKNQGMWHTQIFLVSKDRETMRHVKAVVKSVFGGKESLPEPIRTFDIEGMIKDPILITDPTPPSPGQFFYQYSFLSTLNSADLASFVNLPTQEMPGFVIRPYARFHVSRADEKGVLSVGEIMDQGARTGNSYKISLNSLRKHGLVVGTTGSGKTNTLFYLLKEAWKQKVPFLVLEPAKTEYRSLLYSEDMGKDINIFTLGDNNVSPFRINPFEVLPGVPVQTHVDLLKSVFNASFFMWGPLPHVLERCIHEIYLDKGWDLSSGQNLRGIHENANPTLTDLYNKIDDVVDDLGYSRETTMEISSALKTRINSLRLGGKGLMLDTRKSIPFDDLMGKPTILELEPIGDDEEKAFMMGLILTRMYENYGVRGIYEGKGLAHVTIIEEAHRLLSNSARAAENPYVANVKGKAVETFMNILSEIRAYGEGFLIAEQIPTKLASDVVKNTNLKIMHRLVAEDDRRVMGEAMNVQERETKKIVSMNVGEAAVFSEGDDGAYHLIIPYSKIETKAGAGRDNDTVRKAMEDFRRNEVYIAPYGGCLKHCRSICRYKDVGDFVSSSYRSSSQMAPMVLSIVDGAGTKHSLLQMLEMGKEEGDRAKDPKGINLCSTIHCTERYFDRIGNQYSLSYEDTENLKNAFLMFYVDAFDKYLKSGEEFSNELPDILDQSKMSKFRSLYKSLSGGKQPTSFCKAICPDDLCVYRFNMPEALDDDYYHRTFVETMSKGGEEMRESLGSLCKEAADDILPGGNSESMRKIALCFALQKSYSIRSFTRGHIETIMTNLLTQIGE